MINWDVLDVVLETEDLPPLLFKFFERRYYIIRRINIEHIFSAEGGFVDFVVELGAKVREKIGVVDAWGIAR